MMRREEEERLKHILKQRNPFSSSSAGDPWESRYPDVKSLNQKAFEGIYQLITQKAKHPQENFAGLVLGEVGEGKTHLIGRILEYSRMSPVSTLSFSFAYIQPIEDSAQTYRYLLREVMANLCHSIDFLVPKPELGNEKMELGNKNTELGNKKITCLDRMLAQIFKAYLEKRWEREKNEKYTRVLDKIRQESTKVFELLTPEAAEYIEKKSVQRLTDTYPHLPDNFLKVLFQYRMPEKRNACVRWLKGSFIDDEDALLLGISKMQNHSDAFLEQNARDILYAFSELMACYKEPMIICFDRLENLETDDQIRSLGKMIEFLTDTARAMLPVAFARELQWDEKFKNRLNNHVVTRLETNKYELEGCTPEMAVDIVRLRLASVIGENQDNALFPFNAEKLMKTFKQSGVQGPRRFITQANHILKKILEIEDNYETVDVLEQLQKEFEKQYQAILADIDRYEPDCSRLKRALELYLSNIPPENSYEIESLTPHEDGYIDFECKIKIILVPKLRLGNENISPVPCIFIIDTELNASSVRASLNRGINFLKRHPKASAIYIRDKRCGFPLPPKWKATNEILEGFKNFGGKPVFLDTEQAAAWYALALLSYAVKEGDITVTDENSHMRSVAFDEFVLFIREKIHSGICQIFQEFDEILISSVH